MKRLILIEDSGKEELVKEFLHKFYKSRFFDVEVSEDGDEKHICINTVVSNAGNVKIAIETLGDVILVNTCEIVYIQSSNSIITVYFDHSPPLVSRLSLSELEKKLEKSSFIKVNDTTLLNLNFAGTIHFGQGPFITLTNGLEIDFDRKNADNLLRYFEEYSY